MGSFPDRGQCIAHFLLPTVVYTIDDSQKAGGCPLFAPNGDTHKPPDHKQLYAAIDEIQLGDVKWESFDVRYTGERPLVDSDVPPWMKDNYTVYFRDPREVVRNILSNPSFKNELDLRPYREFVMGTDERRWSDFMSADWAWNQVVGKAWIAHLCCV